MVEASFNRDSLRAQIILAVWRLRSRGLLAAFLLPMAVENDKGKGKQTKDESVFFGFGDELAVDDDAHGADAICRKEGSVRPVVEGSRKEVADGFVD